MAVNSNTNTNSGQPFIVMPQMEKGVQDKLIDLGVKGVIIVAGIWGVKKLYNTWRENRAEDRVGKSAEAQQATALRLAMNPSGRRALWWVDGVDKPTIFNIAKNIRNFSQVIEEYRAHYRGDNLTNDLRSKLSAEEMNRFLNTVNYTNLDPKGTTTPSGVDLTAYRVAIAKGTTNIRKTPKYAGNLHWYTKSNVIKTAPAGSAIGVVTGRKQFDETAQPSGILFMEVKVLRKNAPPKDGFNVWVAASQVETITAQEFKQKSYPSVAVISKEEYDKATAPLQGMKQPQYEKEILSIAPVLVLDEQMRIVGKAPAHMILGFPIMELKTENKTLIQFLTVEEKIRWADKELTKTIER